MIQEQDASVARAEQFSVEVQCVSGLAEKAKRLHGRMSTLQIAGSAKILKGGKSPATRSKQKKDDVEAKVKLARGELDGWNSRVV